MLQNHLVRIGALGHVGRFSALDQTCYPRQSRVIVRSARGLELGEVLSGPEAEPEGQVQGRTDGAIVRGMTIEDQLLEARLQQNRLAALEACTNRLEKLSLPATLLDAEYLFDGRTLVFYFLGETSPEIEAVTAELAEEYESQAQIRRFAETLTSGCGPDCGTEAAGGCQSCASGCAVASACGTRRN